MEAQSGSAGTAPPGWYPDPLDPQSARYWDGVQWTENRAPGVGTVEDPGSKLVLWGWLTATVFTAIIPLMAIGGVTLGILAITRGRRTGQGIGIIIVSLAVAAIFFGVWSAVFSSADTY